MLLAREPHVEASAVLWALCERGQAEGLLAAHSVPTLHYLARRARGPEFARDCVRDVLAVFGVARVDAHVLRDAAALGWLDFEDAVCAAAALHAACDLIATRDPVGFRASPLPALDPLAARLALELAAQGATR